MIFKHCVESFFKYNPGKLVLQKLHHPNLDVLLRSTQSESFCTNFLFNDLYEKREEEQRIFYYSLSSAVEEI